MAKIKKYERELFELFDRFIDHYSKSKGFPPERLHINLTQAKIYDNFQIDPDKFHKGVGKRCYRGVQLEVV